MFSKLRLFELKNTKFKTKRLFSRELIISKVFLEVGKFTFLANFRSLTLQILVFLAHM